LWCLDAELWIRAVKIIASYENSAWPLRFGEAIPVNAEFEKCLNFTEARVN